MGVLPSTEVESTGASSSWWPLSWADVVFSAVDMLEIALATLLVAGLLGLIALWKWKPQLSIEQDVSSRWLNDDTLCVTAIVRVSNTSSYRHIAVSSIAVELRRLAPLTPDEASSDHLPVLLPQVTHPWEDKSRALRLDPGETATDIFNLVVPKTKAANLKAITVHASVPEEKGSELGWITVTPHDIEEQTELEVHSDRRTE